MMRRLVYIPTLAGLLAAAAASAQEDGGAAQPLQQVQPTLSSGRIVTLAEALDTARRHQPQLAVARAETAAAEARVGGRRAPLLPQVSGSASYARQTHNTSTPMPGQASAPDPTSDTVNYFSVGASASQLVWDFGSKWGQYRAAQIAAEAQREGEDVALSSSMLAVRAAYLTAVAQKALVAIAAENLAAQERHLAQVQGFVAAGARPEIDLAQLRADAASARLVLVQASSAYDTSKAALNQAMGVAQPTGYDVTDEQLPPLEDEDAPEDALVTAAEDARPELKALEKQAEAIRRQVRATKGDYWPTLGVSTGLSDAGTDIQNLAWNWNATATLSWPVFQGGATRAAIQELEANHLAATSELDAQRLAIRTEVASARLEVAGAKAAIEAAGAVVDAARETLRLAEARYEAGAGSIIELQDAQTALTNAKGQAIQAAYGLSLARARLLAALGRD
jgi:outer membrane protein